MTYSELLKAGAEGLYVAETKIDDDKVETCIIKSKEFQYPKVAISDDAISYKNFLRKFTTDEETIAKINALDDGNCFLHGDFHPGNVMLDENDNAVLIDMMNVCKGTALYDVARTYFLLSCN